MITLNKRITRMALAVGLLLLIPLFGTLFTKSINWGFFDFIAAGVLLLGTGLLCELVVQKVRKTEYRVAICVTILVALFLVWAELAVGIFGTLIAGN